MTSFKQSAKTKKLILTHSVLPGQTKKRKQFIVGGFLHFLEERGRREVAKEKMMDA
jgi:hypothetical protein